MLGSMSKIDDMRKMREKQFEDAQRAATRQATNGVVKGGAAHAPAPETARETGQATGSAKEILVAEDATKEEAAKPERKTTARSSSARKADAVEGRCSSCGKVKALQNGMIANHQKGFGKMCVGSRKEPA
jgi:hypothetical protein